MYHVLGGDETERLDVFDTVLLLPRSDDSLILFTNTGSSTVSADLSIKGLGLDSEVSIGINTLPPTVLAIEPQLSTTPDGTYAVGDTLYFEVTFDKPVEVSINLIVSYQRFPDNDQWSNTHLVTLTKGRCRSRAHSECSTTHHRGKILFWNWNRETHSRILG